MGAVAYQQPSILHFLDIGIAVALLLGEHSLHLGSIMESRNEVLKVSNISQIVKMLKV